MTSPSLSVSPEDVLAAAVRIRNHVVRTPVLTSPAADARTGAKVYFKCENLQRIGAFKFRGAANALLQLTSEERKRGVAAFSSGNHAQAISLCATELGIPSLVVMPADAPPAKIKATRDYGAEVVLYDRLKEDREKIAADLVRTRGMVLVPPYDHPQVMAGQGTAAVELFEEVGTLDYLFVCVGGGGLIAGSALAARHFAPECRVIGYEPETGNDGQQSFLKGERVKIAVPETIADGARTQVLGHLSFPIIQKYVHSFGTVSDSELCAQMRFFMEKLKIVVEPTGCLSAALALSGKFNLTGKKVGVIVSGGNVGTEMFSECLARAIES